MDKKIEKALEKETKRQNDNIELIASENYVSEDVLKLQGSIFTNKYAEGYPSKRYYGGCDNVDTVENIAIEYLKEIFGCKYANVQPHSGSSANMAVYRSLLEKGDTVLGMDLSSGGHLTHGHKINFSGQDYNIISYGLNKETELIDYEEVERLAYEYKPKMIIAGASAYSRIIDFKKFREIADSVGAYLMVDMAHIAGLVATGFHPNPVMYADVVTSTTHKTLRGPRGGIILTNSEEIIKKINKTIFPGIQGGPLMHVIAAKAQCFYEAKQPEFKEYISQVIKNINALTSSLTDNGFRIVSGKSDNHLILIDLSVKNITGKEAEELLDEIGITVNKNSIPDDKMSPLITSGIRVGSPAMTSRGLKEEQFYEIGNIISDCLLKKDTTQNLKNRVSQIIDKCNK